MPQNRKSNAANKNSRGKGKTTRNNAVRDEALNERPVSAADVTLRNDIAGVGLAIVAVAMFFALASPSSAVITHATERALTQCFGIGAFLCPVALLVLSFSCFMGGEGNLSRRVTTGVTLIAIALLALFSLNVAGSAANPDLVLSVDVAPVAGGYVGGFVAWLLLTLVGQPVGNVVLVGLIATGVVVCGFSISNFMHHAQEGISEARENIAEKRAERTARKENFQAQQVQDPADGQATGNDSNKTTYLGSRKTSVLTRGRHKNASDASGQAKLEDKRDEASAVTRRVSKKHPDLDVETAIPAETAEEAKRDLGKSSLLDRIAKKTLGKMQAPEGEKASEAASSAKTPEDKKLTRRLAPRKQAENGKAPDVKTSPKAEAAQAVQVPDFLKNPKVKTSHATSAADSASERSAAKPQAARTAPAAVSSTPARPGDGDDSYELPPLSMLSSNPKSSGAASSKGELDKTMRDLQETLEEFGLRCHVVDYVSGPLVTTFRIEMGEGERVNKIKNLEDDIALTLAAEKVRIYAPIPGTSYVGVEIPNKTRQNVHLGDVLPYAKGGPLEVAIGRDSSGKPVVADIAKMPHMLVAGTTGSGKSVMINSMIMSLLMRTTPKQVRLIMIDPKRVEFSGYNGLPHLYVPVVTEPRQAASALQWAVSEMERRLKVFERAGARNIKVYNRMCVSGKLSEMDNPPEPMPYIVIIIDELSDLMMVAGKDVEASIVRIAQLARAAGIHLIIATQRPSANVVTGLIKSNIDTRAALKVSSGIDSRVILDETGAERLLGNGDMLFKDRGLTPRRVLGCYTSDNEIEQVVSFIRDQAEPDYHEEILTAVTPNTPGVSGTSDLAEDDDPLVWEAAQIVVESQLGSTSGLQRRLKVGYARAGRIMDMLEAKGVVGPPDGSKPREVLLDKEGLEDLRVQEARYREVE